MAKEFKWGIIGPGRIAKKFADTVHALPDTTIHAIASRSSNNLDELRTEMHAKKVYSSYAELVEDGDIDALYIATPHRFHHENAMLCLESGKPSLVEKAFTINAREAEELIATARTNNLFLMEAMWTRFMPILKDVRSRIESGKIGDVRLVSSTLGFTAEREPKDRLLNIELAGGTVLDLGVYNLAIDQFVYQRPPNSISAQAYIGETGVDECTSVIMNYGCGSLSMFTCTFLTTPLSQVEIYGSKGHIILHGNFFHPEVATIVTKAGKETIKRPSKLTGFEYQIEESQRCISEGKIESSLMTHQDSLDIMRLMDQIRSQIGVQYPWE